MEQNNRTTSSFPSVATASDSLLPMKPGRKPGRKRKQTLCPHSWSALAPPTRGRPGGAVCQIRPGKGGVLRAWGASEACSPVKNPSMEFIKME
ncbi:uncharacterized protein ACWYII_043062 isoform 7-T9 [Salvelinus alpinus]